MPHLSPDKDRPQRRKRHVACRNKVKTGCKTCRIRKIKCDEDKPSCQKCVKTGRTCDGYESPFRLVPAQAVIGSARACGADIKPGVDLPLTWATSTQVTPRDIGLLNHYLCIKTIFNVKLGCSDEARQILQASITDPPIRHAVSSLKAIRTHIETSMGESSVAPRTTNYNYGLQDYNMALNGLAMQLSSPNFHTSKSALLCCQVLISIEQARANFAAMALHIIRGLSIMREYQARPYLQAKNLVPASHEQLPLLDVYIVKLFAAPCKFAEPSATAETGLTTPTSDTSSNLRQLAPNMRTELVRISTSTLKYLDKVSQVQSAEGAVQLLTEKEALLSSLESWLGNFQHVQKEARAGGNEPLSLSFMVLFQQVLKITILGTLDSSPDVDDELRIEGEKFQSVANYVTERLGTDRDCGESK